ncbi:MAG: hypothetical protein K1X28_00910 [Parachlamydiales bacterium]|nr:hypothetical protein [Parachlamydiales bacterium]
MSTPPVFPNLRPQEGKKSSDDAKGQQQQRPPTGVVQQPQQGANPYQQYWQGPPLHPQAPKQQPPKGQQQGRAPVGHGHRKQ